MSIAVSTQTAIINDIALLLEIIQPTSGVSTTVPIVAGIVAAVLVLTIPTLVVVLVRRQRKKRLR